MPIYEYECQNCGHHFEELQSMSEAPLVKCPNCGKDELKKLIGSGGGIIFKGSGFYQTDYKKPLEPEKTSSDKDEKQSKEKPAEKSSEKSSEKSDLKSETKKESKPDSKPEQKKETKREPKSDSKKDSKSSSKKDKKNKN
jgi:putative FmdB family regulatory protein